VPCPYSVTHITENRSFIFTPRNSHFNRSLITHTIDRTIDRLILKLRRSTLAGEMRIRTNTDILTPGVIILLCLCACVCASTSVQEGGWKMRGINTLYLCKYYISSFSTFFLNLFRH